MEESASTALRAKKDSSMRVAINSVKEGRAGACVSAGNTGALLAISKFVLKTLPGIARPAISTTIPSVGGHTHMLDLGANVDCSADHLFQFAVMGGVLANAVDSNRQPRVGLLNIGSEDIKGNEQVKGKDQAQSKQPARGKDQPQSKQQAQSKENVQKQQNSGGQNDLEGAAVATGIAGGLSQLPQRFTTSTSQGSTASTPQGSTTTVSGGTCEDSSTKVTSALAFLT